ncbi:GNAT family N-acetyltransferase [Ruminiclostridium herbifermentans]|uniref:GNAT family N-acetyltransferase n=1 Tax=Ruminiclostridium herbifermentans TaxID=2488810 RepID=A0A7H1VLF6_9FIRM|nr:GNAT family N-acetyltransferase [Ruminiclostridium herbifermentans]QNU66218.1 GNAT family N-acetyltransferase [Ruminiclostridium herbifermentans]
MDYKIKHYKRPKQELVKQIVDTAKCLTTEWFTPDVLDEIKRDLLFHDVICIDVRGEVLSFLIFTSWEGAIQITLMGTKLDYRGKGLGSKLIEYLFVYVKKLGFNRVSLLTVD